MNRACTSSLHTVADAVKEITFGHPSIVLAGGVECLSDVPIVYSLEARKFLLALNKAKTNQQRFNILKIQIVALDATPSSIGRAINRLNNGPKCRSYG